MSIACEPILYALSIEPPVARPGATVTLRFGTPNLGTTSTAPGIVRFTLEDGLIAEQTEVAVPATAPGGELCALLTLRIADGQADGRVLSATARLVLPNDDLPTNACSVQVRCRPVLDGPESRVDVARGEGDDVLVRAQLVNTGDGALHGARLVLEPPAGCVMRSGEPEIVAIPVLEPGARFVAEATATIAAACSAIRADGSYLVFADGTRAAVAAGNELALCAVLEAPMLQVAADRRACRVEATIANTGWDDARDVTVRVVLPAGARLEGGVEVDGVAVGTRRRSAKGASVFASLHSLGAAHDIRIARVPARSRIAIVLRVTELAILDEVGTSFCTVSVAGIETQAALALATVRDLRLRVAEAPHAVEAGSVAHVVMEAFNAGDIAEHITLEIESPAHAMRPHPTAARTFAPGTLGTLPLVLQAPTAADGTNVTARIIARDGDGNARAEVPLTFVVRARCWIALTEAPVRAGESVRYTCAHRGVGEAVTIHARWNTGDRMMLDGVAPGSTFVLEADPAAACSGGAIVTADGVMVCELPPFAPAADAAPAVVLTIDRELCAGAPFMTRAIIEVAEPLEQLRVHVIASGCTYAAGSTRLDGHQLLDRSGEPGMPIRDLVMRGIPAQRRIVLEWTSIAGGDEREASIALHASTGVAPATIASVQAPIDAGTSFALRPAGLDYHVEARTAAHVAASPEPTPLPNTAQTPDVVPSPAFAWLATVTNAPEAAAQTGTATLEIALDAPRIATFAALLGSDDGATLAHHLVTLRALLPDHVRGHDDRMREALLRMRDAVGDVFDRLYVKLRIPGFEPIAADFEDSAMRGALIALYDALSTAPNASEFERPYTLHAMSVTVLQTHPAHADVRAMLSGFADAPFGSADTLRALLALAPTQSAGDDAIARALTVYARELAAALEPFTREPLALFEDALVGPPPFALSTARRVLAAAVRARAAAGAA